LKIVENDVKILQTSALKGVLTQLVDVAVTYVNAPNIAIDRGIDSSIFTDKESSNYRVQAKVEVTTNSAEHVSVSGTISGTNSTVKLVGIDKYELDVAISDHMAFLKYSDKPGMLGLIGGILGKHNINIANLQLSREAKGGTALVALTLDSEIPQEVLNEVAKAMDAKFARVVNFN
jgi:D-3-phosphoglycerate dehydrogenase